MVMTDGRPPEAVSTRARVLVAALPLALLLILPLVLVIKTHSRDAALGSRGVTTQALVIGSSIRGQTDFLLVRLLDCGCEVYVATSNLDGHAVGSTLTVRYDPTNPSHARALVDAPNPYAIPLELLAGIALSAAIIGPLIWAARRRRQQALALVANTAPTRRVRVQAWERSLHNSTMPFVSVYPIDEAGGRALLCFPISARQLAEIRDDIFDLYGSGVPGGPVALRAGRLTITPAGKSRSADWEAKRRTAHAGLALEHAGTAAANLYTPLDPPEEPGPLFAGVSEARAYRRNTKALLLILPLLVVVPFLRLLPLTWLWVALPLVFAGLFMLSGMLWQRERLLDRMAARRPGSTPVGRAERKAARRALGRLINSPAGQAELASLLATTPDRLAATVRRSVRATYCGLALLGFAILGAIIRIAIA